MRTVYHLLAGKCPKNIEINSRLSHIIYIFLVLLLVCHAELMVVCVLCRKQFSVLKDTEENRINSKFVGWTLPAWRTIDHTTFARPRLQEDFSNKHEFIAGRTGAAWKLTSTPKKKMANLPKRFQPSVLTWQKYSSMQLFCWWSQSVSL